MATRVLLLAGAALSAGAVDEVTYGSASAAEAEEMMEPTPTKMSFKPPQLDEEESESRTVPAVYRCDVCAAVAYQIEEQFQRAEKNKSAKRKRRLSEMEILCAPQPASLRLAPLPRPAPLPTPPPLSPLPDSPPIGLLADRRISRRAQGHSGGGARLFLYPDRQRPWC
eukprot:COSAG04_NODE_219_length_19842_cov_1164.283695_15_plen_168_part_00